MSFGGVALFIFLIREKITFLKLRSNVLTPSSLFSFCAMQERVPDSPSPAPSLEEGRRPGSHPSSHRSSSVSSSPARTESSSDRIRRSYPSACHPLKLYLVQLGFLIKMPSFSMDLKCIMYRSSLAVAIPQNYVSLFGIP